MATGRLGAEDLALGVMTPIYTVPATTLTTLNLNICNRNVGASTIKVALINGGVGSIVNADYIEYDIVLPPTGVLERTGIVLQAGYTLAVESDVVDVSVNCWGFEDSTL